MKCINVDDDDFSRAIINDLVAQVDFLTMIGEFSNTIDVFNFLQAEHVDLIFLDVEMPGISGVEFVKHLTNPPIIIFISSQKDHALEAVDLNVADFIVKPITLSRFTIAVSRANEIFESRGGRVSIEERDYIFVRNKNVITKIKLLDIYYIQALGDYITIFSKTGRHTAHITLGAFEKKIADTKFCRIHRSYIVSIAHIDYIEDGTLFVNKNPLPIGDQFKHHLYKLIDFI